MAKITMLQPRLGTLPTRVIANAGPRGVTYGQGRGGRPWRRFREQVMRRDNNLCQPCQRAGKLSVAKQVDHITPLAEGGAEMDMRNAEAVCLACHAKKTQAEAARGRARR